MNRNLVQDKRIYSYYIDEKNRLKGFFFFILLLGIGASLVFVSVNTPSENIVSSPEGHINFPANPKAVVNNLPPSHRNSTKLRKKKDFVKYTGALETYSKITFALDRFDNIAQYAFDFGDGQKKFCKSSKIEHAYSKSGTYTVRVKVYYDNKVSEVWVKKLTIRKGLDIDEAAFE